MHIPSTSNRADPTLNANPHTTHLAFSRDKPRDSAIVDADSNRTLYLASTKRGFRQSTTTLSTSHGDVVAVWEKKSFDHDYVTVNGQTCKLSDWLPKKHVLSGTRIFSAPNGKTYHWKERSRAFQLVDASTEEVVANSTRARKWFTKSLSLSVHPELAPMLDIVLFAFIVLEERRREAEQAAAGADAAASGAAAAGG